MDNLIEFYLVFGAEDCESRAPTHSEMQQLFLPYRGFCARKGVMHVAYIIMFIVMK